MNTKVVPNPEQKGWEEDGTTPNGTPIYKWESGGSGGGSAESAVLQDREEDQQVVSKFTVTANPTQDGMGLTNIPNKLVVDVDEKRASFIAGSPNSLISDSSEPWDVDLQGSLNMKSLGFPYSDIQYTAYGLSNSAGSIRLDSAGFSIFSGTINAPDATFSGDVRSDTRFVVSGGGNFRKHDDFGGLSIHGSGGVAISTNANAQDRLTIDANGVAEFSGPVKINGDLLASKPTAGNDAFSAGFSAGLTGQGEKSVAIGRDSGKTDQGSNSTAVGAEAGKMTQGDYGIAVGHAAGNAMQGISAVAVGVLAGSSTQGDYSVAIGRDTGSSKQGANSTAVGRAAGKTSQSDLATAIGYGAGRTGQGKSAVAIGDRAGNENQAANGIIINSSGASVDSTTVGHIIIKSSTQDLRSLPNGGFAMNRDPIIGTRSLINTLSTLRNATKDETTLEGLRDSIGNAIGGLIEKYEAEIATMPAPEPEVSTMEIEA
jgi:hypothetical protein